MKSEKTLSDKFLFPMAFKHVLVSFQRIKHEREIIPLYHKIRDYKGKTTTKKKVGVVANPRSH